jgi:hypothetical protein
LVTFTDSVSPNRRTLGKEEALGFPRFSRRLEAQPSRLMAFNNERRMHTYLAMLRRDSISRWFLLLLSVWSTPFGTAHAESAIERFQSIQEKLRQARTTKDWQSGLIAAKELEPFLNGSPNSLLETARAELHVNDVAGATAKVQTFARMGQSTELIATSAEFAALQKSASFPDLRDEMKANRKMISRGSMAFELADPALLVEDIDYDSKTKRFFITSVGEKKIISADPGGAIREFAKSPDDWPMMAIKVDTSRGLLWATEVAMRGLIFAPKPDWGRSAVLCYELKSGKLLRRMEGPAGSALGDMTLMSNGDAIVSDGDGGGIYRVSSRNNNLERVDAGDFISPQTPAMHADGKHIFVPDYLRGIGLLDLSSKQVRWLSMDGRFALNGIDGLYFRDGVLFAVQNGASPERVISFQLNAALTDIVSEAIIERSTPKLGDPTHGVVIGNAFYYIANSGWDVIDDQGNLKPGANASPARIVRLQIDKLSKTEAQN